MMNSNREDACPAARARLDRWETMQVLRTRDHSGVLQSAIWQPWYHSCALSRYDLQHTHVTLNDSSIRHTVDTTSHAGQPLAPHPSCIVTSIQEVPMPPLTCFLKLANNNRYCTHVAGGSGSSNTCHTAGCQSCYAHRCLILQHTSLTKGATVLTQANKETTTLAGSQSCIASQAAQHMRQALSRMVS